MSLLTDEQFSALYARLEKQVIKSGCSHTLRRTRAWLQSQGVDVRENIEKIVDLAGHCDCEVLMNIPPSEWKAQRDEPLTYPDIFGDVESSEFVSQMMLQAIQHTFEWKE